MPPSTRLVQAALVLLAAAGAHLTWVLMLQNGTGAALNQIRDEGPHLLPGTSAPLRQHYTGIGALDGQLQTLMIFFHEVVAGIPPAAAIQVLHFGGQLGAAWTLLSLEMCRAGSKGGVLAVPVVWGLLLQNAAYAVMIPVYLAIHLSAPRRSRSDADAISVSAVDLAALPVSIVLGFVLPSALFALPAPGVVSFDQKQILGAVWQVFPIWSSVVRKVVAFALPRLVPSLRSNRQSRKRTLNLMRGVYATAVLLAGCTHIAAVTLPLAYDSVPSLFHPSLPSISIRSVFLPIMGPAGLSAGEKVQSVGVGAQTFLQYDELVGSAAVLLWAIYVYSCSLKNLDLITLVSTISTTAGLAVLLGPVGAAVSLIWMRDEDILGPNDGEQASGSKKSR